LPWFGTPPRPKPGQTRTVGLSGNSLAKSLAKMHHLSPGTDAGCGLFRFAAFFSRVGTFCRGSSTLTKPSRVPCVSLRLAMLDKEPLVYPSRGVNYPFDPGVSNRQLWAIGMIVVQWSMTETIIEDNTRKMISGDVSLLDEYKGLRGFRQRLAFWRAQIEWKVQEPTRSQILTPFLYNPGTSFSA
jgi:hypothetical protein